MTPTAPHVVYITGTYPLLTTTFIDREIRMLRSWGAQIDIVALRRPPDLLSPEQFALAETVTYPRPTKPLRMVRAHAGFLLRKPGRYLSTLTRLILDRGQSSRQRLRTVGHFGLAVYIAADIEASSADRLHAHFIDRSAIVAKVVSELLAIPYSITAHASDIYVEPALLETKIKGADFVATCTQYNHTHLVNQVNGAGRKVELLYHGLEFGDYSPSDTARSGIPSLIAVGQLKEKKGYLDLLSACRKLVDADVSFQCRIVGEGPQRRELEERIETLGLGEHVTLLGALPHGAVIDAYREADAFVLPCVVGGDGDRDGIPNVILEAMAMQLPVVSTEHSGIPEAVAHGETGLLVPPRDPDALAHALTEVLSDRAASQAMGARGREVVVEHFDAELNVRKLYDRFTTPQVEA